MQKEDFVGSRVREQCAAGCRDAICFPVSSLVLQGKAPWGPSENLGCSPWTSVTQEMEVCLLREEGRRSGRGVGSVVLACAKEVYSLPL